jgi:ribosome maturation factor RimP
VVPVSQLATLLRADVQLLTGNGKRIDGQVKQVLGDHLVLEVRVVQGNAELNVPLDKIQEVRIFDRKP